MSLGEQTINVFSNLFQGDEESQKEIREEVDELMPRIIRLMKNLEVTSLHVEPWPSKDIFVGDSLVIEGDGPSNLKFHRV